MSEPPDEPGKADAALILAKAALSAVPIAGGPVAELLDLIRLPVQKRQHVFLADLARRLRALEQEGRLTVDDVVQHDAFLDATTRALEGARKTAQAEKLDALRNAVLSVALDSHPDEAQHQMFLEMVDRFTVWHLRILRAFDNPPTWAGARGVPYHPALTSSLDAFLLSAFPELAGRRGLYDLVWSELWLSKLVNTDQLHGNMSADGWRASRTSDLGKAFLAFIAEPEPNRGP